MTENIANAIVIVGVLYLWTAPETFFGNLGTLTSIIAFGLAIVTWQIHTDYALRKRLLVAQVEQAEKGVKK